MKPDMTSYKFEVTFYMEDETDNREALKQIVHKLLHGESLTKEERWLTVSTYQIDIE